MECRGFSSHAHKVSADKMAPVRLFHERKFGVVSLKLKRILLQLFFGVFKEEYKIETIPVKLHLNLKHFVHKMEEAGTWNFLGNGDVIVP